MILGLKTPQLLILGITRLVIILIFSLIAIGIVLSKYQEITNLIWTQPESNWIVWLWHITSWLLALLLSLLLMQLLNAKCYHPKLWQLPLPIKRR